MMEGHPEAHPLVDEDTLLIGRFRKGDSSAFEELVIKYQSKVFNTAYRMLSSYQDASDTAQEVFIRAYKSLAGFRGDSKVYTWLYRITVNTCLNKLKSRKPTVPLSDCGREWGPTGSPPGHPEPSGPIKRLQEKELQRRVQEGIQSLPARYRSLIILRDMQGLRYQEVAEVLDCSLEAVRSSLYRARQELRTKLEPIAPHIMDGVRKTAK
jgi:RNA polymerase sigma-70 factor (ECF subfamily)